MDNLATLRRAARYGAYSMSAASCILTAVFAWNQSEYWYVSMAVALFLVVCSLSSDYIGLFVVDAWRQRNWQAMGVLSLGLAVAVFLNLLSNVGSVGWQRQATITDAKVTNTRYDDKRDSVASAKANLASAQRQRAQLLESRKNLPAWAATATATAVREQLATARKLAAEEASPSRGGCGPMCRKYEAQVIELERKLGPLESKDTLDKQLSDLDKRIAAANEWLASAKQEAAQATVKVAAPESQAGFFGSVITANLSPSDAVKTWVSYGIAGWIAIGMVFLPIVLAFVGFKTDSNIPQRTVSRETPSREKFSGKIEPLTPAPAAAPMGFLGGNSTINIHDEDGRKLLEAIRAYASNKAITV